MKNELYHHGIEGQKWGVMHGPPYPLSRSESRAIRKQAKREEKSRKAMEKRGLSYKGSKKYAKRMTDEDLNAAIDRLQREETYRRMVSKDKESKKASSSSDNSKIQAVKEKLVSNKQNKDEFLKRALKDSVGSGIRTMSGAAFNKLASELFKDAPSVEIIKTDKGLTVKGKDPNKVKSVYNFFMKGSLDSVDTSAFKANSKSADPLEAISKLVETGVKITPMKNTKYNTSNDFVKPDIISSVSDVIYSPPPARPLLNSGIPKEIMDMKITDIVKNT